MSVLVDFKTHLGAVELQGAVVISAAAQLFRELVKSEDLTREVTFAGLYYLLSLLICEPAVRPDDRAPYPVVYHICLGVKLEYGRVCKLLLVGAQRADAVRQMLGQHRDGAVHKIYARCALLRLAVYD